MMCGWMCDVVDQSESDEEGGVCSVILIRELCCSTGLVRARLRGKKKKKTSPSISNVIWIDYW